MTVYAKMKTIGDNIRLRTGGTELLNLDEIAEAILTIGGNVDMAEWVHNAIGATFPPAQLPAETAISGSDIDILSATADDVYSYIDAVANSYPDYAVKETLGKEASGRYDMVRYMLANREYYAWQKQNYPKMYAWEDTSGGEVVPNFTNVKGSCYYNYGYRYSLSGGGYKTLSGTTTVVVPVPSGSTSVVIRFKGVTPNTSYTGVYGGTSTTTLTEECTPQEYKNGVEVPAPSSDGVYTFTCPKSSTTTHISFHMKGSSASDFANTIITVNEPIEYVTVGGGSVYSTSVSPRIGDTMYSTPYVGTAKGTVSAVNATNRSRTVGGAVYVRQESGDIEPTVIYTNKGDSRNSGATITQDGATYNRYPLGDLGTDRAKLIPIFIYANEHGIAVNPTPTGSHETKMPALIAARFIRDLCSGANAGNAFYKYIRENCMVIVIPVANPFGFNINVSGVTNTYKDGYYNYNNCNINRNYDTPGWDVMSDDATLKGGYAGSQNETQYIMNTMVESGAAVAMSLHGLGSWEGYCAHQGQQPDGTDYNQTKLAKVVSFLKNNYGYTLRYYDSKPCQNLPATTSKSPSYITQSGAYGGIVEFSPDDVKTSGWKQEMKSNVIENAYAQMLNLMAMWLSDYLEQ